MKILFINLPYYGHVVPTIGLVQELTYLGCQVTYMLPFGWEDLLQGSGAVFYGYRNHPQLSEQIKNAWSCACSIAGEFDLILYEQFFFLGKHLADKHGKPVVRIFTAPVPDKAIMEEYISSGPLSVFRCKWIARAFTKDIAKDIPMKTDNWLDEILFNPPQRNLVYTLRESHPCEEAFPEPQFVFLGPSVYPHKQTPLCLSKGTKPLVYISLGTVLKGSASFFRECVEAFRDQPADVIISVGKKFRISRLKNLPANISVYPYVPQQEILGLADVFVTHGGMNSVSEALVSRTPMVVIPFVSDQPLNGRCVEKLGVGKILNRSQVNRETLRQMVFSVLSDSSVRECLAKTEQLIKESPGNAGGARIILEYWKAQNSK